MEFNILARSIKGKHHKHNQDYLWVGQNSFQNGLLIIADGVGSYDNSQLASKIVIKIVVDLFKSTDFNTMLKKDIFDWGENIIKKDIQEKLQKIKNYKIATTLTFVIIKNYEGYWFHVGNTRLYSYQKKTNFFWQITKDHNLVENVDDTFSWLKGKRMLQNAISNYNTCYLDFGHFSLTSGYLFLSSDGLHDFISQMIFEEILPNNKLSINNKSEILIDKAIFKGSLDDISFIFVTINEDKIKEI